MGFDDEIEFEKALIEVLKNKGWSEQVLKYPTEQDLIENWKNILFQNNRSKERLGDYPLTQTEMAQILEQINKNRTPLNLNKFINGGYITIKRDNPDDINNNGKEINLKIYDKKEIAAGQSSYQIVEQPRFNTKSEILNKRRGDIILLINGMPVIHIELKKSGVPISEACNQIEKYSHEGVYTGLFSLIQIFVAMTPEETIYFANPGQNNKFNKRFYFHWGNFYNNPINDWRQIAEVLLSSSMAHQLIGFYTVADDTDGVLKVMRSYQYWAASKISDKVSKIKNDWKSNHLLGGYIWHTTGSGKTMTSFKTAGLISNSGDADKVVFLMDRIELGTQALLYYKGFADDDEEIQETEDTADLIRKLKSDDSTDTLIVTSIQKMSRVKEESGMNNYDIEKINSKRIVFIVDECHRSTFGDMLITIKETFPYSIFFGFTGTPIDDENNKNDNTTATIFGDELHRYTIAEGIKDGNVLGFDTYKVPTFKNDDIRLKVALHKAKAKDIQEALADEKKKEIFNKYMYELPMIGIKGEDGTQAEGVEDSLPNSQYQTKEHRKQVVDDIVGKWSILSRNKEFSGIFATANIKEAIIYYRLIKQKCLKENINLNVTGLFDPTIDNKGGTVFKEDGLVELIEDYNKKFGQSFSIRTYAKLKKDIALRLAHKKQYKYINKEEQIDLLIVVEQMLTGYDSKYINTLYVDKVLEYENIIQAFSRTNRIYNEDKKFGTIKYYRRPYLMEQNIEEAIKKYSGNKPYVVFVEKLNANINKINRIYMEIKDLFTSSKIGNFEKLPEYRAERAKFAKLFKELVNTIEAAKIQGFNWKKRYYEINEKVYHVEISESEFNMLLNRYKELANSGGRGGNGSDEPPYDLEGYITTMESKKIDAEYINSKFEKWIEVINQPNVTEEELEEKLAQLHKSFSSLTQEERKFALIFIRDIQSGQIILEKDKTFKEYITEYQTKTKNDEINKFSKVFGLDENKLRTMIKLGLTEKNINEYNRFNELKETIDRAKAKEYFESKTNTKMRPSTISIEMDTLLRKFILTGGFDIDTYFETYEDNYPKSKIAEDSESYD